MKKTLFKEDFETALRRISTEKIMLEAENNRLRNSLSLKELNIDNLIKEIHQLRDQLRLKRIEYYAEKYKEDADWWYTTDGDYSSCSPDGVADYCDLYVGGFISVLGAKEVAVKYVAHIAKSYDEDGDLEDSEYLEFDTSEEARRAIDAMPKPERKAA